MLRSLFIAGWIFLGAAVALAQQPPGAPAIKQPLNPAASRNMPNPPGHPIAMQAAVPGNAPAPVPPAAGIPHPVSEHGGHAGSPEQSPAQPPKVIYQNGQLTVESQNSTLADILQAIHTQTGAQLDLPGNLGHDRVAFSLSGSPREVVSQLLENSRCGYIILGSPQDPNNVQQIILKSLPQVDVNPQQAVGGRPVPGLAEGEQPPEEEQPEAVAEPEPPPPPPPPPPAAQANPSPATQPGQPIQPRTPQQMLQELQKMRDAGAQQPQQ